MPDVKFTGNTVVEYTAHENEHTVWDGQKHYRFDAEKWDVEVTITATKRVKPIPDGTLANEGQAIYVKRTGRWWVTIIPGKSTDRVDAWSLSNVGDGWIRENTKPLNGGEWED